MSGLVKCILSFALIIFLANTTIASDRKFNLGEIASKEEVAAAIEAAKATMIIYFDNPVAIGEHPQHLIELDKLNEQLANAEEKLISLRKHFNNTQI